jgi:hypothetical protein
MANDTEVEARWSVGGRAVTEPKSTWVKKSVLYPPSVHSEVEEEKEEEPPVPAAPAVGTRQAAGRAGAVSKGEKTPAATAAAAAAIQPTDQAEEEGASEAPSEDELIEVPPPDFIDDPTVFHFEAMAGVLSTRTAPARLIPLGPFADHTSPDSLTAASALNITFLPTEARHYRSTFAVEVEYGNSVEFTLCGEGSAEETSLKAYERGRTPTHS